MKGMFNKIIPSFFQKISNFIYSFDSFSIETTYFLDLCALPVSGIKDVYYETRYRLGLGIVLMVIFVLAFKVFK